jgi:hypothetical protein
MRASWLASVAFLAALVPPTALISCSSGDNRGGTESDVFDNSSAGISLTVPDGWHATMRRFTPLVDPYERATLTSYPVEGDARPRGCSPDGLLEQMPRTGVVASLLEYMDGAARRSVDPRPRHFRLRTNAFEGFDCFGTPPGRAGAYAFNFSDSGRAFQLLVAVGRDATPTSRLAATRALDSIRIEPCDRPLPSETKPRCRRPLPD